jgi:hypothetical protein
MSEKKPKLAVVGTGAGPTGIKPPRPLGEHGMRLWKSVVAEYNFSDTAGQELLHAACAALDRAQDCATQIAADGPVIRTKAGIREHPALRAELANRSFLVRTLVRLGLNDEPQKAVGRPPQPIGWKGFE